MRIGIDARLYGIASGTGIGRYTEELIRALAELNIERVGDAGRGPPARAQDTSTVGVTGGRTRERGDSSEFVIFLRRNEFDAFTPPDARWTKVLADFRPYTIGVQTKYPRLIRAARVDLMHFTHFDHPIQCPVPFVTTIHDLILLHHPSIRTSTLGPIRFWGKYIAYRAVLWHALRKSRRILTPSQTIAHQLHDELRLGSDRVTVTRLGVDHVERGARGSASDPQLPAPDSLVYIGNSYPHKNLEQLVRIAPKLKTIDPDLYIILVGREDDFSARLRDRTDARTPIVFAGALPEDELRRLLTHAFAYVSPSLDEGFDLPTVEALALGTPVIATEIPVHREVLGDHALFFRPNDDAELLTAIHRLRTDGKLRSILMENGREHARRYTWRVCATETLAAYVEIATP